MEIVSDLTGYRAKNPRTVDLYKKWKQPLHKWDSFVSNRHKKTKVIDDWSKYIIDNTFGRALVYQSGGLFFYPFIKDLTVVEASKCPIDIKHITYMNAHTKETFDNYFNTMIMICPISLKYHHSILDFLTVPGESRAGYKPNLLKMIKNGGQLFLSTLDWFMYFNRLKYSVEEYVDMEIKKLNDIGLECIYKNVTGSTSDYENGNIKLRFKKTT